MYSKTGIIPPEGMKNAENMLLQFDPELKDAKVDLSKTFDSRFVAKATEANGADTKGADIKGPASK
jgi:NitT/TauT family transport system substrate-binding protein